MGPELYHTCLNWVAERDSLQLSRFLPAQLAEVFSLEEELKEPLPALYEEHLLRLGSGEEFGGLSRWLHIDLSKAGNVLDEDVPGGFLPIYDSCEGELFGYFRNGVPFSDAVFIWEGKGAPEVYTDSLSDFYVDRLDCSKEEIELIKEEDLEEK